MPIGDCRLPIEGLTIEGLLIGGLVIEGLPMGLTIVGLLIPVKSQLVSPAIITQIDNRQSTHSTIGTRQSANRQSSIGSRQ